MEKQAILSELNRKKQQLHEEKERLAQLEDQLEALEAFSAQCTKRIRAFEDSIGRRKNKLLGLDALLLRAKSAKQYKSKMNDLLTGKEYLKVSQSISNLETSVSAKKRDVKGDIQEIDGKIAHLKREIKLLQHSYDTYPEEAEANG